MKYFSVIFALIFLFSCSQPVERKVMVFFNGELKVFQQQLTNKTTTIFNSDEFDLSGFKNVKEIEVDKDGKTYNVPIPQEQGYYVLNLSSDTIYGGRKPLSPVVIDSANVAHAKGLVDSLQNLLDGKSTFADKNTYRILPDQLVKISDKPQNVRAFPPYKDLYGAIEGTEDGSEPEIFKFNATEEVLFEMENYKNIYTPVELKNSDK